MTPIALTIAGSDSSGGAGIQADLKTFAAFGVYGASVITALTAQNTPASRRIHNVPAEFVTAQIDAVFSDLAVGAVKIGMLACAEIVAVVARGLDRHGARNIVLDPVMIATSGDRLLRADAVDALWRELIPRARLVTPNLPEAAALLARRRGRERNRDAGAGHTVARRRRESGADQGRARARGRERRLAHGRCRPHAFCCAPVVTSNTHGTGCTLSSAIAAGFAKGLTLAAAVGDAKAYITAAIAAADQLSIGKGHGPVHHFHAWWKT